MNPTEIAAKRRKEIADLNAKQSAALTAADAEGVSAEDKAKHLQEFDDLQAKKEGLQADLKRADQLARDYEVAERTPATPPVVQAPHNPHGPTAGAPAIPAQPRRHGRLKAFKNDRDGERDAYLTGLWVAATQYGSERARQRLAEYGMAPQRGDGPSMTMTGSSNTAGGYLVPDVMDYAIFKLTEEYGVFRRLASIQPMSSDTWTGPRWTTAMTAYWVGEGAAPTQKEPGWDAITLVAKNLAAYGKMTRQLNEDALVNLGDEWAQAAAIAFAYAEDNAGFNGDGTSTYGGITGLFTKIVDSGNSASLVTATGHSTLATLTLNDFWNVVGKYPNYPGANPVWLCHKEVYAASMGPLQTAAGGVTAQDVANGGIPKFLGYPVEFVNVAPKAASVTSGVTGILFADLSLSSKLGDRRGRTLESGMINDDLIKQLMTLFAASRVDINNHTIVDPKNTSNAGPVIGLKLG